MTKNPRDYRTWTNRDAQQDPQGYRDAQRAYHEDQAKAKEERLYRDDLASFTAAFVAAGGAERDAEAAFKAQRRERAAAVARTADEQAVRVHHRHISQTL